MQSKPILVGLLIGIVIGSGLGYIIALSPDVSSLEAQISIKDEQIKALLDKIVLIDISFSGTEDTSSLLEYWIGRANQSIQIMVMLITQDELADALIEAQDRGVDVDIIIDDEGYYNSGSDYQRILDSGVDIRGDERSGLMHHKIMIIDDYIVITGSYNWSDSAEDSNDENIIILNSTTIADIYLVEFDRLWSQTTPPPENGDPEEPEEPEVTGHIVINEVEPNPEGTDTGNEWVELYNPTSQILSIGGWKLSTTHGYTVTLSIPQGTTIAPGEYKVYTYSSQWIDNDEETVILRNAMNQVIDTTPLMSDTDNSGKTWARSPNGVDTDSPLDWEYQLGTKGLPNN